MLLYVAFDKTLNGTCRRQIIFFQLNLAVNQERIRLNKNLARLKICVREIIGVTHSSKPVSLQGQCS